MYSIPVQAYHLNTNPSCIKFENLFVITQCWILLLIIFMFKHLRYVGVDFVIEFTFLSSF